MPQSSPSHITETRTLKALSNPIRMRILTVLRTEGPQNVGRLAERIGQAPGSVSYHLTQLASVHLIVKTEPASGSDRRTSWWKAADDSIELMPRDFDCSVEFAFGQASLSAYSAAYSRFTNSDAARSDKCRNAVLQHDAILDLTKDETEQLMLELDSVLEKWVSQQEGRERSEKTRQFALILLGFPWIP